MDNFRDVRTFQQQFCCEPWRETMRDVLLRGMAEEYHERTEAFDRRVCSCLNKRGVAIPMNGYEAAMINANARQVYEEMRQMAASLFGVSPKEWQRAVTDNRPK